MGNGAGEIAFTSGWCPAADAVCDTCVTRDQKGRVDPVTGHKPFNESTKNFTPQRRARVAAKAAELREAMTPEELRKARSLSQEELAEALTVGAAGRSET
jgi:ribosome-binding protein aMBF1 (putative translation factor)